MSGIKYDLAVDYSRPIQALIPGVQGRILGVLAETTDQLNLTTIAQLAGVSQAQASRVLPELVHLGVVDRVEAPPSSLFRLVDENLVGRLVRFMTELRHIALREVGECASRQKLPPELVIVFGSFARGEADADSDLDVVIVRPTAIDDSDSVWATSIVTLQQDLSRVLGNAVNVLEVGAHELGRRLKSRSEFWQSVRKEGIVVYGDTPENLSFAK